MFESRRLQNGSGWFIELQRSHNHLTIGVLGLLINDGDYPIEDYTYILKYGSYFKVFFFAKLIKFYLSLFTVIKYKFNYKWKIIINYDLTFDFNLIKTKFESHCVVNQVFDGLFLCAYYFHVPILVLGWLYVSFKTGLSLLHHHVPLSRQNSNGTLFILFLENGLVFSILY